MKQLNQWIAKFDKLSPRERLMAVGAVAVALYFVFDVAVLGPQQKKITQLHQQEKAHLADLAGVEKVVAEMQSDLAKGLDPLAKDRAQVAEYKKRIAEVDAFLGQTGSEGVDQQLGVLVRELMTANPRVVLVSLKTLPSASFYTPGDGNKVLPKEKSDKPFEGGQETQKTLYKHGVEISVKGSYMALLSYMRSLQQYPRRLFWSDAKLDVSAYPDAVLKLVVYTVSEQPNSPLS